MSKDQEAHLFLLTTLQHNIKRIHIRVIRFVNIYRDGHVYYCLGSGRYGCHRGDMCNAGLSSMSSAQVSSAIRQCASIVERKIYTHFLTHGRCAGVREARGATLRFRNTRNKEAALGLRFSLSRPCGQMRRTHTRIDKRQNSTCGGSFLSLRSHAARTATEGSNCCTDRSLDFKMKTRFQDEENMCLTSQLWSTPTDSMPQSAYITGTMV